MTDELLICRKRDNVKQQGATVTKIKWGGGNGDSSWSQKKGGTRGSEHLIRACFSEL